MTHPPVRYAGKHDDAYPTFYQFSASEAKKRNHSKVSTGVATTNTNIVNRHREESKGNPLSKPRPEIGRILNTIAAPPDRFVRDVQEATRPMLDQQMADLPQQIRSRPTFTNVGIDAFGPWAVQTRRTIGGAANSKRWV
ncbi:hypothetical protein P5673_018512 [Acropora cervicornis]|uniref:Uncharacterized protein n=1 Tax=Acropora cervicornis TaxID=6130 RepID=A0AAD9QDJ4_ACRCE|nr:hypothetical protein P5673_018512 [Acropora cervicornis]